MKTRLLIIIGITSVFGILIWFVAISSDSIAYGLWMPETPEGLFEQSQTVFVGTITSVNVLEFQRSNSYNAEENGVLRLIVENYTQPLDQYTVNIEEFLKNPQKSNTITMLEATVSGPPGPGVSIGGFELGDRVLFYVPKLDGTNQYSPESFKIPKSCNAKDVVAQKRLQMGEDFTVKQDDIKVDYGNFTANKPIEFVYSKDMGTLDGKSFDVAVVISKNEGSNLKPILNQEIHAESKPCEWIASATWGFTPEKGDYTMSLLRKQDNATNYEYSGFSVKSDISNNLQSPLNQFKSGISLDKIQCREGFAVVIKKSNGNPGCVKRETLKKLRERGWAEPLGDIVFQRHSQTKSEPAFTPYSEDEPDYHFDKTFTLIGKKSQYNLDYLMPNGTITNIQLNCDSLKLVLSVSSTKSGVLTLLLPEEIIGNIETIFVDKMQWNYISYAGNTVTIMIPENTETVEIKGSYRDDLRGGECR